MHPTAIPSADAPGSEHCCCGKVHFVGRGVDVALTAYLSERKARRNSEPEYLRGASEITLPAGTVEVAWAFPSNNE